MLGECAGSAVDDGLKNQSWLVEEESEKSWKEFELGEFGRCNDKKHWHNQLKTTNLTRNSAEPGDAAGEQTQVQKTSEGTYQQAAGHKNIESNQRDESRDQRNGKSGQHQTPLEPGVVTHTGIGHNGSRG